MLYESTTLPPPPPAAAVSIAPWLHTALLLALLTASTAAGHMRATSIIHHPSNMLRYTSSIILEWVLLALVIAGIRHRRVFLQQALRSRVNTLPQALGLGLAVYVMGLLAIAATALIVQLTPLARKAAPEVVLALLPHTHLQFALWFAVSLTAGLCEELIFRGYLLQQFTAWTARPILAIFLSAFLFGSVHLYEGLAAVLPLTALAVVYGFVVRHYQGDLRAVIVAHTLQDFLVAVLASLLTTLQHALPKH